jgi:hypothetical protein
VAAPTAVIAGHFEAGPYRDALLEMTAGMYAGGAKEMNAALDAFFKATTGDVVATLRLAAGSGMSVGELFGVSDTAAANRAVAATLDVLRPGRDIGSPKLPARLQTLPDAPVHDGVALPGYRTSYDLSKAAPAERKAMEQFAGTGRTDTRMTAFDGVGTVVTGSDSVAAAGRMIDAVRGKAPRFVAPPAVAQFLTGSRARKDSMAMTLDLVGLLAGMRGGAPQAHDDAPLLVSLGFADRRAHFRIAAPVTSIRAMMAVLQP